jgi:DNA modification methylase
MEDCSVDLLITDIPYNVSFTVFHFTIFKPSFQIYPKKPYDLFTEENLNKFAEIAALKMKKNW